MPRRPRFTNFAAVPALPLVECTTTTFSPLDGNFAEQEDLVRLGSAHLSIGSMSSQLYCLLLLHWYAGGPPRTPPHPSCEEAQLAFWTPLFTIVEFRPRMVEGLGICDRIVTSWKVLGERVSKFRELLIRKCPLGRGLHRVYGFVIGLSHEIEGLGGASFEISRVLNRKCPLWARFADGLGLCDRIVTRV